MSSGDPNANTNDNGWYPGWYERKYFEAHAASTGEGFWDVYGKHTAHHLLDYVRVWDVPKDVNIPNYSY